MLPDFAIGLAAAEAQDLVPLVQDLEFRCMFKLGVVSFGTDLDLRTTTSQNCEAVPRRARIQGSWTFVSLNYRLESNREEEKIWGLGLECRV